MLKTLCMEEMPGLFHIEIEKRGWSKWFTRIEETRLAEGENPGWQAIIIRTKTRFDRAMFRRFPDIKLLIRAGTGFDNIELCAAGNVVVCNAPEANANAAAEHTLSFMLSLIKHLPQARQNVIEGKWRTGLPFNPEIPELKVLLVGVGRVGGRVAKSLRALGAEVRGVDPYLTPSDRTERGIEFTDYYSGLQWCNVLSFHCPLTEETRHYFSETQLDSLELPIWLINTSRGAVVDIKAVEDGLDSGKILGAALDVFEQEPWIPNALASNPRVILSPHSGARTKAARERLSLETLNVWEQYAFKGKIMNSVSMKF